MPGKVLVRPLVFALLILIAAGCGDDLTIYSDDAEPVIEPGSLHGSILGIVPDDDDDEGSVSPDLVQLTNGLVQISFERASGRIVQMADLRNDQPLNLLDESAPREYLPPMHMSQLVPAPLLPHYVPEYMQLPIVEPEFSEQDGGLLIRWKYPKPYPIVEALWEAVTGEPELRVTAKVVPQDANLVEFITYPILPAVMPLDGSGEDDYWLASNEGGYLLRDPLNHLDYKRPNDLQNQVYPAGHGMMSQMVAYLHPGLGGLLLYAADPDFAVKAFSLFDRPPWAQQQYHRVASFQLNHYNPDVADEANQGGFIIPYATVFRWLDEGEWTEAADRYREWSDKQVWASNPLVDRDPQDQAFFKQVGATVFGLSARMDHTAWIKEFHDLLVDGISPAQLLFVLGWDFHPMGVPEPDTFTAFYQAGYDERYWTPLYGATVDNTRRVQEQGDLVMPFLYDLMIHSGYAGWEGYASGPTSTNEPFAPWETHRIVGPDGRDGAFYYWFPRFPGVARTLCPADSATADWWLWRDKLLQEQLDPPFDGLYFDLGFPVVVRSCYDHLAGYEHGHPSGAGVWMIDAVRNILDQPRGAPTATGYRFGAENANEPYIDLVDFWHLGSAGVGPLRDQNPDTTSADDQFLGLAKWIMNGDAVHVPLTSYLYHHLGTMRTGGKAQISYEIGDAFYWIAASEYAWGGVMELIYFNAPVDWLWPGDKPDICPEGQSPCAFFTSWAEGPDSPRHWYFGDDVYRADPAKLAYLKQAIDLRVNSPAAPYLTMGRMERPPALDPLPDPAAFSYDYYSSLLAGNRFHAGVWQAQPVVVTAWRHPERDSVLLLAANASDKPIATGLSLDSNWYGYERAQLVQLPWGDQTNHGSTALNGARLVPVKLPPRDFLLFEMLPN